MITKTINSKNSGLYTVKTAAIKTSSKGTQYMYAQIVDADNDSIKGNLWKVDDSHQQITAGSVVYCEFTVREYNNAPQANFTVIRPANTTEKASVPIPASLQSEVPSNDIYNNIMGIINNLADVDCKNLCNAVYQKYKEKIVNLPAGKSVHHDYIGGLMDHCYEMAATAEAIRPIYSKVANMDLVVTGCLLHDIAKMYEFELGDIGTVANYSVDGVLFGHLYMGAKLVSNIAHSLKMPTEKIRLIEHMIVSHHGDPEYGAIARPAIVEAAILSEIDMLSAKVNMFKKAYAEIPAGHLSENNVFPLATKVYRPNINAPVTPPPQPQAVVAPQPMQNVMPPIQQPLQQPTVTPVVPVTPPPMQQNPIPPMQPQYVPPTAPVSLEEYMDGNPEYEVQDLF